MCGRGQVYSCVGYVSSGRWSGFGVCRMSFFRNCFCMYSPTRNDLDGSHTASSVCTTSTSPVTQRSLAASFGHAALKTAEAMASAVVEKDGASAAAQCPSQRHVNCVVDSREQHACMSVTSM